MIRTLRRRFIAAAMLAFLAVALGVLIPTNVIGYSKVIHDADTVLDLLGERWDEGKREPLEEEEFRRKDFQRGWFEKRGRGLSPDVVYSARYFCVVLDQDENVEMVVLDRIFAVDNQVAENYARTAIHSGRTRGFCGSYRYLVQTKESVRRVIFLSCERSMSICISTLTSSVGVCIVGGALMFFLLQLLSGRIIRPLAESYAKQRQFITDAGHEIKTPLTIIGADADLLELELGENEWLEDIRRQTQRLAGLTNDLVYLSRMDEEQPTVQMIEFPVSDVVEETAQSFQAPAVQQEKTLTLNIQPMLSYVGSEKEIRQLVSILLDNSLKYSPAGTPITLNLEREGKNLVLTVTNTSVQPLDKEKLGRLFDRFYRLDASRNSSTGGYGLGMSIARGIAMAHKGKITAETPDGVTLTVRTVLPCQ